MSQLSIRRVAVLAAVCMSVSSNALPPAYAGSDLLVKVVDKTTATGDAPLGAFAYDPITEDLYVAGFGSSPTVAAELRRITDLDAVPTPAQMVSSSQWMLFTRDGDPNRKNGQFTVFGMLLNPKPIEELGLPAYSAAWIVDQAKVVEDVSPVSQLRPDLTQRIYRYNLQPVPAGQDGRAVFTSVLTEKSLRDAAGTSTGSNIGRQFAWSGDGQSLYVVDSQTGTGGLWKIDAATGAATWLYRNTSTDRINTEPAVLVSAAGDRILVRGTTLSGNKGGIDAITYDGSAVTGLAAWITGSELAQFLELSSNLPDVLSISTDADGNAYFCDSTTKNLIRRDPSGRLSKIVSKKERDLFYGTGVNNLVLRMQPRTVSYAGPDGSFDVTQILYAESSPVSEIAGVYAFKPGDFDRDNTVDAADGDLFEQVLALRVPPTDNAGLADYLKYDLNGNGLVNWTDVKILQGFLGFNDGDATLDGLIDYGDLAAMSASYLGVGKLWSEGDFTGDGIVNAADLSVLASNWDLPKPDLVALDGLSAQLRADAINAFSIPEPRSVLTAAVAAVILGCRRRRAGRW